VRVEITLERMFCKIERVLAKIYWKIYYNTIRMRVNFTRKRVISHVRVSNFFETHACQFLRVDSTRNLLLCIFLKSSLGLFQSIAVPIMKKTHQNPRC
jgi:hypothetical protein